MQLTDHTHAIKIPFKVTLPTGLSVDRFVYAYLIYTDKVYLIDSGVKGSERLIFDYLKESGKNPHDIEMLILTHSHPDHIGAAQRIHEESGCIIAAHNGEKHWIEDTDFQFQQRPVPGFYELVGGSVEIDRILEDNEEVEVGNNLTLKVIHTPGHSKGLITLYMKNGKTLFAADAILRPGDLPIYEDITDVVESIKKLKTIGDIDLLLSAWDDPRKAGEIPRLIDDALGYLKRIHEAVLKVNESNPQDSMELCKRVVAELGLPAIAVNPLVGRSFASHLKVRSLAFE